jgi:hydrogenase expression/formation protein HypD
LSGNKIKLSKVVKEFNLSPLYETPNLDEVYVVRPDVSRPGLPLAGFFNDFEPERIQLFGNMEHSYLKSLSETERFNSLEAFFSHNVVCVVLTNGITPFPEMISLAEKYNIPFVVAGFEGKQLLAAIWALVKLQGQGVVKNLYPEAVKYGRNQSSYTLVEKYFEPCEAAWRGLGVIENSGLRLKGEYSHYDAGSGGLYEDFVPKGCSRGEVIAGLKRPEECPLFGKVCTPVNPVGACMVSQEGSCFNHFNNK